MSPTNPEGAADALVTGGPWSATDDGWQLVWLLDDQPTAAEAEAARIEAAERMRRVRRHNRGGRLTVEQLAALAVEFDAISAGRRPARQNATTS